METKAQPIVQQESLCINTEKVYDWILGNSSGSTTIAVGDLPIALPVDAINVSVNLILTDAAGTPIPINSELDVTETMPRQDVQVTINGALVTLQRVTFRKSVFAVLEVSGVDSTTGIPFLIITLPIPFNFVETALLCAPVGTSLVVRVSDFSSSAVINLDIEDVIVSFGLEVFICQSIQTVAPVTVGMVADFCTPREILLDQCANPTIPPQCPVVFPGQ